MKKKEKIIIECAMKLFASKGFEATSIQEIADLSGMSKGTFYLYFKSKESLLMSIFQFYYDLQKERMNEVDTKNLTPREQLQQIIIIQYEDIKKHTDIIVMYAKEQAIPFNNDIAKFLQQMHDEMNDLFHNIFRLMYGPAIEPYLWDISTLFTGIFHSFAKVIIFNHDLLDFKQIAIFISNRLDSIVNDLLSSNEKPIINNPIVLNMEHFCTSNTKNKEDILLQLKKTREQITNVTNKNDIVVTLEVLEEEIRKEKPRLPVIQGMLANLSHQPELTELESNIISFFNIPR